MINTWKQPGQAVIRICMCTLLFLFFFFHLDKFSTLFGLCSAVSILLSQFPVYCVLTFLFTFCYLTSNYSSFCSSSARTPQKAHDGSKHPEREESEDQESVDHYTDSYVDTGHTGHCSILQ